MLPKFLQSSYIRYKDDTNSFATWLLKAAGKCGYQPQGLTSTAPTSKNGKNKSRNKAANDSDPVQYTMTVKDLQLLADVVAKSALTVPTQVLIIVKRAIKLRKHVTSWFLGQGDSDNNKRHTHFISALEKVCETLEWKMNNSSNPDSNQPPPTSESGGGDADLDMFLNKFAVLTVEEPQETQEGQQKSPESKQVVKVEIVENDEDEDTSYFRLIFFKTYCMFQDLNNMRAFISHTWSEYRDNKIDLMNAAIVTDSALQLARDLVQEVVDDWSTSTPSIDNLQEMVFNVACFTRGIDATPSIEIGLPYNKHMSDVAEWCYLPTRILLESFRDVLQDNHLPVFKKGFFGTYDPKANREGMSVGQKFNEDKIIFVQLMPEFCMIDKFGIRMLTSDAITAGLVEFCRTKKATLWLSFAAQVLLDVHHIMRYSILGAFDDLRMSGLRITKTIDDYFKGTKSHPQPQFWPKEGDEEIKDIHFTVASWIIQDPFLERKRVSIPGYDVSEKHVLFSQHAILCGLSLFHLNTRMQSVGQQLVTQWYDVQQLAFLYNLANTDGHMNLIWPDMEAFIKIHGESHIFIGSRPKNASESLNRLELATGISSAAKFARGSRKRQDFHRPDGKNPRVLTPTTTIANLFRAQYVSGFREEDGIRTIDNVLDTLSQEPCLRETSKELQPSDLQVMFQQKWSHTRNIGTLQLLTLLKSRLSKEEPLLLFNYFGMHKRSLELLRLIRAKEHHKFVQYFTTAYMPDESLISNIVILVHHVARGSAQNARALGMSSMGNGSQICSRIVMSCGEVMRDYLRKNGDVACKELRVFCKNKKPIQDEIDYDKGRSEEFGYWFGIEEALDPKVLASLMTGIPIA
ncbi:hypothetical protein DTO006G1_533 [Penicillium roqueforti]|uniref:Genomic scaffold, ProqFM164S03 n=1 Tax=Penicillium roqueforti (strain FM164) TaxID=1365484 RepID=W6QDG9_PENRF|nr:hypothetical protein CBS147337_4624 [Penicillium roqueforti]CDM34525.1 unnamed protein product [Penicillium roqueforti FM164]KAI2692367.1 hypothetical protein LCP963914a_461 [Penicillium roqueforti]KAI2765233.1 hypothetical protein DTO006G1_533 [Penicillium roqueforti]KAI3076894.1 hypothetical protein CBS147339_4864 [Penicillium roqueforti]